MDCIFCKIVNREIESGIVYEDDTVLAFNDLSPQAKEHILIIPKQHIGGANEITEENSAVVAHIFEVAARLAREKGLEQGGYRIVNNCGKNAGQTVFHLHFHLLGGEPLDMTFGREKG